MTHDSPVDLNGAVIYHCGPVMLQEADGTWRVKAAGPTTSIREEPYQADILRKFGVRAVIGKGGMGSKTSAGLQEVGAVYLNAIGGAAQFYAEKIMGVTGVDFLKEFGVPGSDVAFAGAGLSSPSSQWIRMAARFTPKWNAKAARNWNCWRLDSFLHEGTRRNSEEGIRH